VAGIGQDTYQDYKGKAVSEEIKIDSELAYAEFMRDFRKLWLENHYLIVKIRKGKQRTLTQNNSLHLFCEMLADELNAGGFDMRKVMKPEVEIPWTMESVKQNLWKPIQEALIGKESTAEADRTEYTKVHELLSRHLGQKLGVQVPEWPKKKKD
jgi:regulator of sigma D